MRLHLNNKKYVLAIFFITIMLLVSFYPNLYSFANDDQIYIIKLEGTINKGLSSFIKRALDQALENNATLVVIEMDTLGGSVDAAMDIAKMIRTYPKPIITYVTGTATSAGAYLALNTPTIVMSNGSTIGAAEPRNIAGDTVDPKILAFWKAEMEAAAEIYDRDEIYAAAMVDKDIEIEGLVKKGELLSLTAKQAVDIGYAEGIYNNRIDVLQAYGYTGKIIDIKMSVSEKIARLVTNPFVMILLLTVGFIGIVSEFILPGFGVPGIVGVSALAIYFTGHIIAGAAGYEVLLLFLIGIILLIVEFFIPGFGITGISGLIVMGIAIVIAAIDTSLGLMSLFIALIFTVIISIILIKIFGFKGVWNKFILSDTQQNKDGYAAPRSRQDLLSKKGITLTPLRPAGTAEFDGELIDVVAESGYIATGRNIYVVKAEGVRVVVREISNENTL